MRRTLEMGCLVGFCILALALAGCGGATVKTSIKTESGYEWTQEISGKGKVVIEAAGMNFSGSLHVNPETGALDLELRSGQDAKGLQSSGLDLAELLQIMQMVRATP